MSPSRILDGAAWPADRLAAERERRLSVVVPARDEAATIGSIVDVLVGLRERGAIDEVLVLDDSTDATAEIAAERGAEVVAQSGVLAAHGPVLGKGDALWRGLAASTGDVVCFVDGDTTGFAEHFVGGLLGPLCRPGTARFAKACYRRPWTDPASPAPDGGGRVTELTARPLLHRFFPELTGVLQPLAGEVAADRDLLEALPFRTGYGVDVALLIDALAAAGPEAIVQVDLGERRNRHRPLHELGPMAAAVLDAVLDRAGLGAGDGRFVAVEAGVPALRDVAAVERPPLASLRPAWMPEAA